MLTYDHMQPLLPGMQVRLAVCVESTGLRVTGKIGCSVRFGGTVAHRTI